MVRKWILVSAVFLLGSIGLTQQPTPSADRNFRSDIGVEAGAGFLNNNGGTNFTWGFNGDYGFQPAWKVGLQFNTLSPDPTVVNGTSYSNTLSNLDLTLKWAPCDTWRGLKLGVLAGVGFTSITVPGNAATNGNFVYGVTGNYDFPIFGQWTLGPQIDAIWNVGGNTYTDVNAMGALRYWF